MLDNNKRANYRQALKRRQGIKNTDHMTD